jgi:hypothetical protein
MGFPTEIIGSRGVIPTIKKFANEKVAEILKLDEPVFYIDTENRAYDRNDDFGSDVRIVEEITRKEIIEMQASGYTFDKTKAKFVEDEFYRDHYMNHNRIKRFKRAVNGKLKPSDWIGSVHSAHRNNIPIVRKSIVNNTIKWAISNSLAIPLFSILSTSTKDKDEFLNEILEKMSLHKVYDDIITNMKAEPEDIITKTSKYEKQRNDISETMLNKMNSLQFNDDDEQDASGKRLALVVLEKDKMFSIKPSRADRALFVDKNISKMHRLSLKMKEAKIKERLESESNSYVKGKGIIFTKQKKVLDYYAKNPSASLRKASQDLMMDHRTINKYKSGSFIPTISVVKNAPKPSISKVNIEQKGAEITTPALDENFNSSGIRIRSAMKFLKGYQEQVEFEWYEKMVIPILAQEGDDVIFRIQD